MLPHYYTIQPALDIIMNYIYDQGYYSNKAIIFDIFMIASFITMFIGISLEEQQRKLEKKKSIEYEDDIFNEESSTSRKTMSHPNELMLSKLFQKK